jgi:flagellar FliL protein
MKLPLPAILAVAVLVSGGSGAGAVLFMSKGKGEDPAKSAKHKGDKDKLKGGHDQEEPEVEPKSVYSLDETVINLADKDEMRYLKIAVALGFDKKADEEHLKEFTAIMRDAVIGVMMRKTFTTLHTAEGVKKAKGDIRQAVNAKIHEVNVVSAYFESFAMQ